MEQTTDKQLMTVKKVHQLTGASQSFLRQLVREKKLNRYYINTAMYVSYTEFQELAAKGND